MPALPMVIVWWPVYARLMRAQVIAARARSTLKRNRRRGELAPPAARPYPAALLVAGADQPTMDFGSRTAAASLSFMARPRRRRRGMGLMISEAPCASTTGGSPPGRALPSSAWAGFNFLGDGLRDILDPGVRK